MDQNACRNEICAVNSHCCTQDCQDHELEKNMVQFYNLSWEAFLNDDDKVNFSDNSGVNGDQVSSDRRVRKTIPLRRNRDRLRAPLRKENESKTCENIFISKVWAMAKQSDRKLDRIRDILWALSKRRQKNFLSKFVSRCLRSLLFELEIQEDILSLAVDHDKSPKFIASKEMLLHYSHETKEQAVTLKTRRNWKRTACQHEVVEVADNGPRTTRQMREPSLPSPKLAHVENECKITSAFNIKFGHGDEVSVPKLKDDINGVAGYNYNGLIEGSRHKAIVIPAHPVSTANDTAQSQVQVLVIEHQLNTGIENCSISENANDQIKIPKEIEMAVTSALTITVDSGSGRSVENEHAQKEESSATLPPNPQRFTSFASNEDVETGRAGLENETSVGASPQVELEVHVSRPETKCTSVSSCSNDGDEKLEGGSTVLAPKQADDDKIDSGQHVTRFSKPKLEERPTTSSKLPCVKNEPLKIIREPPTPKHGSCANATTVPDDETESSGEEAERLQREKFHKMRRKNGKIKKEYKCELRRKQKEDFIAKIKAQEEAKAAKRKALKSRNENDEDTKTKDVKSKAYGKNKAGKQDLKCEAGVSERRKKKGEAIEEDTSRQDDETKKRSRKENNAHISDQQADSLPSKTYEKIGTENEEEAFTRFDEGNYKDSSDKGELTEDSQQYQPLTDLQEQQPRATSRRRRSKKKWQENLESLEEESPSLDVNTNSNVDQIPQDKNEYFTGEEEKQNLFLEFQFIPNEVVLSDKLQHIWEFKELPEEVLSEDYWDVLCNSGWKDNVNPVNEKPDLPPSRVGLNPPEVSETESDGKLPTQATKVSPLKVSTSNQSNDCVKCEEEKDDLSDVAKDFSSDETLEQYLPAGVTLKQLPRSGFQKYLNDCVKFEFETYLFCTPVIMMDLLPDVIKDVIASARDSWSKLTPAEKKEFPDDKFTPGEADRLKLLRAKFKSEEHYERAVSNSLWRYYKNYFDQQPQIDRPLPVILHRKPILEALKDSPVFTAFVILLVIGVTKTYVYGWLIRTLASWW